MSRMIGMKEVTMTRILEGVFVLGCSLVGLGMGASEGSGLQNAVKTSVQLIALAQNNVVSNVASNVARLSFSLSHVPERIVGGFRHE